MSGTVSVRLSLDESSVCALERVGNRSSYLRSVVHQRLRWRAAWAALERAGWRGEEIGAAAHLLAVVDVDFESDARAVFARELRSERAAGVLTAWGARSTFGELVAELERSEPLCRALRVVLDEYRAGHAEVAERALGDR